MQVRLQHCPWKLAPFSLTNFPSTVEWSLPWKNSRSARRCSVLRSSLQKPWACFAFSCSGWWWKPRSQEVAPFPVTSRGNPQGCNRNRYRTAPKKETERDAWEAKNGWLALLRGKGSEPRCLGRRRNAILGLLPWVRRSVELEGKGGSRSLGVSGPLGRVPSSPVLCSGSDVPAALHDAVLLLQVHSAKPCRLQRDQARVLHLASLLHLCYILRLYRSCFLKTVAWFLKFKNHW